MSNWRGALILLGLLATGPACAAPMPPPNLTPIAQQAWQATRIIKALDIIRDVAIDANAQVPPLITTQSTRRIVEWHQSALKVMAELPEGWRGEVSQGLIEFQRKLPPNEALRLAPYVNLTLVLLREEVF